MPVVRTAICGAILSCGAFALGQSVGVGNAQVDASVSSVQAAAMAGAAVNASVSAPVMPSYGAGESGAGGSHSTTVTDAGLRMASQHFAESHLAPRSSTAVQMNGGSPTMTMARRGSRGTGVSAKESVSLRPRKTGCTASQMMKVAAAGHGTAGAEKRVGSLQSGSGWVASTYTSDFPDSTKRTALVSPPDLGALSPLEWNPHVNVSWPPDLSTGQFLSPSLHSDSKSEMKGRGKRAGLFGRTKPLSGNPLVQPPPTSVSAGSDLILSPAGSLLTVPDTSLPTSVDQQ